MWRKLLGRAVACGKDSPILCWCLYALFPVRTKWCKWCVSKFQVSVVGKLAQLTVNDESVLWLNSSQFLQCRMNMIKVEPESDPETQEPYSELQFNDVQQKFLSVTMPFTEMKTEIKVSEIFENDIRICSIQSCCCKNHLLVMTYFLLS